MRLVTTDGARPGLRRRPPAHRGDHGAAGHVELTANDRLDAVLGGLRGAGNSGALAVVVTASVPPSELETSPASNAGSARCTLVVFEPSSYGAAPVRAGRTAAVAAGEVVVRVSGQLPFPEAWNRGLTLGRAGARAR